MKYLMFFVLGIIGLSAVYAQNTVSGKIFVDTNNNNKWDTGEQPLSNILVSNGRDVVYSNKQGNYKITHIKGNCVFIVKPAQYLSPLNEYRSQFYFYNADDERQSYDFPLISHIEPEDLNIVLLGDPQVDVIDDVHHVNKLVTEELAGKKIDFIVPLGDLTFDNHDMFKPLSSSLGLIGVPVFNVMGNHDQNYYAANLRERDTDFEEFFGPSYYAFEYGKSLCLVLNNIYPKEDKNYIGKIDEDQYAFLSQVLNVMKTNHDALYVFMHIPIEEMEDRERFLKLFKDYDNVFIATGHTHTQYQKKIQREGLKAVRELVAGAVCGSWWQGPHDSANIPFAYMYDGTPKGYWFLQTKDNKLTYKVSGKPEDFQMEITVPEINEWDKSLNDLNEPYIYANVFAGENDTNVQISFDGEYWQKMNKYDGIAPKLKQLFKLQELGRFSGENSSAMPNPKTISTHLWRFEIPKNLPKKTYLIQVKAIDSLTGLNAIGKRVLTLN